MEDAKKRASSIIDLYPEIFPHLYKQPFKLEKYIETGGLIIESGVVITFDKYKKSGRLSRNATAYKKKGDFILHQIASDRSEKGATKLVLDKFVAHCKQNLAENLWLTVRAKNERAVAFYERYGFKKECDLNWHSKKDGKIPGIIFRLRLVADKNIESF